MQSGPRSCCDNRILSFAALNICVCACAHVRVRARPRSAQVGALFCARTGGAMQGCVHAVRAAQGLGEDASMKAASEGRFVGSRLPSRPMGIISTMGRPAPGVSESPSPGVPESAVHSSGCGLTRSREYSGGQ